MTLQLGPVIGMIGRLGGGIEWHDLPAPDPMDMEANIIEIQEECILLAVPEDGIAEVSRPDFSERWATVGLTLSARNPVVAARVGPGEWLVTAFSTAGTTPHPVRYAIIPTEHL